MHIVQAPINYEARKHNEKLPRMGGVFNTVNLHTYHYAGNNPIKYVDPDGKESEQSFWDTFLFKKEHPDEAKKIGKGKSGGRDCLSSVAINFAINSKLSKVGQTGKEQGSPRGAYRHVVWQAVIYSELGESIAIGAGDAHDPNTPGWKLSYSKLGDADRVADQMNNRIGRRIAKENPGLSHRELALKGLERFRDVGLYVAHKNDDGTYSVLNIRITEEQYNTALKILSKKDEFGLTP